MTFGNRPSQSSNNVSLLDTGKCAKENSAVERSHRLQMGVHGRQQPGDPTEVERHAKRSVLEALDYLVKQPCARSHSNASKLDAVLAKQCFTQFSVATRDVFSPSVVSNAWICALRATDHDLESVTAWSKVNAWIRARPATHHNIGSVIPAEKS